MERRCGVGLETIDRNEPKIDGHGEPSIARLGAGGKRADEREPGVPPSLFRVVRSRPRLVIGDVGNRAPPFEPERDRVGIGLSAEQLAEREPRRKGPRRSSRVGGCRDAAIVDGDIVGAERDARHFSVVTPPPTFVVAQMVLGPLLLVRVRDAKVKGSGPAQESVLVRQRLRYVGAHRCGAHERVVRVERDLVVRAHVTARLNAKPTAGAAIVARGRRIAIDDGP